MRPAPNLPLLVTVLLALSCAATAGTTAPVEWLVIEPVDRRSRHPFNPDAVFARYLLDRASPPPREGEEVEGERKAVWTRVTADEQGRVEGRIAYAYAALESDAERIVLARLQGGATLFVNGDGFAGDVYGMRPSGVPILLREGLNHLFVRGVRGRFSLALEEVAPGVHPAPRDATLPDVVAGRAIETDAGIVLINAGTRPVPELLLRGGGAETRDRAGLVPLGLRKLGLSVAGSVGPREEVFPLDVSVEGGGRATFELKVRAADEPRRITFRSAVDGSVQEYSARPPSDAANGLVLTLHGAGVDAFNQARAYSAKPDLWIVAPTNRRPFGFDWQDWGRRDAYEALAHVRALGGIGEERIYLTGHSMGGHGAWHLAANDPDRWAAVAPSAGWSSFASYGGGTTEGPLSALWSGADLASDTLGLVSNLIQIPTYVLHGEKDDNVPPREARLMVDALRAAGGDPVLQIEEGKGHWWDGEASPGVDCVDWPAMFERFAATRRSADPDAIDFTTADPGIDAEHFWIRVEQPLAYGRRCRVRARRDGDAVDVRTENARRFSTMLGPAPRRFVVDGQLIRAPGDSSFLRTPLLWTVARPERGEKRPERCGPFKRAFDNRFVLVYPSGDAEALARARYDAQVWWYRGNGDAPVVSDERFLAGRYEGRNVILYGNATTNLAFDAVLDSECPLKAVAGRIRLGDRTWKGDALGCLFVYPRRNEPRALVGVLGHTGPKGARLGYGLLIFTSGVGYPDYAIYSDRVLRESDGGVLAAGWFDSLWRLPR